MDKRTNAFESFITNILKTHEGNDKLRSLRNNKKLADSVDKFLYESQLEAFFIPHEPPQEPEFVNTNNKLKKLTDLIKQQTHSNHITYQQIETDKSIVDLIWTKYSEKNCKLSREILLYLNQMYKSYNGV